MSEELSSIKNLDFSSAKFAQLIISNLKSNAKASEVDNLVTKSLGVLQENGVIAFTLFLSSKKDKEGKIAKEIQKQCLALIKEVKNDLELPGNMSNSSQIIDFYIHKISSNLETLIFCKQVLEQMLIYARYGAKAWEAETKNNPDNYQESESDKPEIVEEV